MYSGPPLLTFTHTDETSGGKAEDAAAALTCLHSSSNCDDDKELHSSSEDLEAQPYRTIFSEGLYFRRMVCQSMATHAGQRGAKSVYGKVAKVASSGARDVGHETCALGPACGRCSTHRSRGLTLHRSRWCPIMLARVFTLHVLHTLTGMLQFLGLGRNAPECMHTWYSVDSWLVTYIPYASLYVTRLDVVFVLSESAHVALRGGRGRGITFLYCLRPSTSVNEALQMSKVVLLFDKGQPIA